MYARNGTVYASSRDVAEFFGKQHAHVIRDINALISDAPSIASNFGAIEVPVKVGFGTRMDPAYEITRDGFTLLAMGFNGKTALAFKVRYVEELNHMEAQLKGAHS